MPDWKTIYKTVNVEKGKFVDPISYEELTDVMEMEYGIIAILICTLIDSDADAVNVTASHSFELASDKDKIHNVDKGGSLSGGMTGAVTSITVTGLTKTPVAIGEIIPVNSSGESEVIVYSSVTDNTGGSYTFTVDQTLTYTYADGDSCTVQDTLMISTDNSEFNSTDYLSTLTFPGNVICCIMNSYNPGFMYKVEAGEATGYVEIAQLASGQTIPSLILQDRIKFIGRVKTNEGTPPPYTYSGYLTLSQLNANYMRLISTLDVLPDALADGDLFGVYDLSSTTNNKIAASDVWTYMNSKAAASYLAIADIVDNLTSTDADKALSANQGSVLKTMIESVSSGFSRRKKVLDILETPPGSPTSGDRYIVGSLSANVVTAGTPTGDWVGHGLDIAEYDGSAWDFTTPLEGYITLVDDENKDALYVDDGTPQWQLRNIAVADHNDLQSIQGGTTDEYYHMTSAQNSNLANIGKVKSSSSDATANYLEDKFDSSEFQNDSETMKLNEVPVSKLSGAYWMTENDVSSIPDNDTTNITVGDKTDNCMLTVDVVIKTTVSTVDYYRHCVIHILCDGSGTSTPEILSHIYPAASNPLDGSAVTFTTDLDSDNIRLKITTSAVGASSTAKWKILSKTEIFS